MPMTTRKIESSLQKKGFIKEDKKHRIFRYIAEDGTKTSIFTHTSHGRSGEVVHDGIISTMAKQCKISAIQFKRLVLCSFKRKQYEKKLRNNGAL